jgi:hypothetical protein
MAYAIGIVLGVIIALAGRISGFDKDRSFYPTILIVIALYYLVFSVIDGRFSIILSESVVIVPFITAALVGAKKSHRLVAAGLVLHGIYDFFHNVFFINAGVPSWWPPFCFAVDIVLALAVLVSSRQKKK